MSWYHYSQGATAAKAPTSMLNSSMWCYQWLLVVHLIVLTVIEIVQAIPIDNGVIGLPQVECGEHDVRMVFNTQRPFAGRIFVKGMVDRNECVQPFPTNGATSVVFQLAAGTCNMRRKRRLGPQRGVEQSMTVIISFHDTFITKVDKAYRCTCFYMEADKVVTNRFDVSMLPTTDLVDTARMPLCTYSVHRGSITGEIVNYARVGDEIFHVWQCDSDMFGMLVHSCFVDDGAGQNRYPLLDEHGCALDPVILSDLTYNGPINMAFVEAHAFKFADRVNTYFQCAISLCMKSDGACSGVTPPRCNGPGTGAVGGYVDTNYPNRQPAQPPFPQPAAASSFINDNRNYPPQPQPGPPSLNSVAPAAQAPPRTAPFADALQPDRSEYAPLLAVAEYASEPQYNHAAPPLVIVNAHERNSYPSSDTDPHGNNNNPPPAAVPAADIYRKHRRRRLRRETDGEDMDDEPMIRADPAPAPSPIIDRENDVDVSTGRITVLDIDDSGPKDTSPSKPEDSFFQHTDDFLISRIEPALHYTRAQVCLSALGFGIVVALFIIVLSASLVIVAMQWFRHKYTNAQNNKH